jgi:hypothetical protein
MSGDQHAGQNNNLNMGNKFLRGWKGSNIWGGDQNSIPEESKSRLNSGNVVCLPVGYPKI